MYQLIEVSELGNDLHIQSFYSLEDAQRAAEKCNEWTRAHGRAESYHVRMIRYNISVTIVERLGFRNFSFSEFRYMGSHIESIELGRDSTPVEIPDYLLDACKDHAEKLAREEIETFDRPSACRFQVYVNPIECDD